MTQSPAPPLPGQIGGQTPPDQTGDQTPPPDQTGDQPGTPSQSQSRFTDTAGLTHEQNINYIVTEGITLGCNSQGTHYCPDNPVTRAQMASFLTRALKLPIPTDPTIGTFQDTQNNTHRNNIRAIAAAGITLGCDATGTRYCPTRNVTRAEMASFLARAFKLPIPTGPTIGTFQDTQNNTHRNNIRAIAAAGITLGCDATGTRYCPHPQRHPSRNGLIPRPSPTTHNKHLSFPPLGRGFRFVSARAPVSGVFPTPAALYAPCTGPTNKYPSVLPRPTSY